MSQAWTWRPMPDPRDGAVPNGATCRIRARARDLLHIATHVAAPAEPWDVCFSRDAIQRIRALARKYPRDSPVPAAFPADEQADLAAFSELLEAQADLCLRAPLVIRIWSRWADSPPSARAELWIMILPAGAVMLVTVGKDRMLLASCYFKNVSLGLNDAALRRRKLQGHYLKLYAVPYPQASPPVVLPRGPDESIDVFDETTGKTRVTNLIEFVTYPTWGFAPGSPHTMVLPQRFFYTFPRESIASPTEPPSSKDRDSRKLKSRRPRRPRDEDGIEDIDL